MATPRRIMLFPSVPETGGDYSSPELWLDAYSPASLQTLCRSRGIAFRESASKRALGALLASELFRSSHLHTHFDELGEPERTWLNHFRAHDGILTPSEIDRYSTSEESAIALRRLTTRGLVLPGPYDGHIPSGAFDVTNPEGPLWCPEPVRLLSNGGSVASLLRPYDGPVEKVREANRHVLEHDLMAMADQLAQAPVRRLKSGFPGKRFLTRVASHLREQVDDTDVRRMEDSGYPLMIYELLDSMGMLKVRQERVSTSQRAEEFFCLPPAERARALFDAWRELTWYNELYQVHELQFERTAPDYDHGDGKKDDLPTPEQLVAAREFIGTLASEMRPGTWVPLESLMYAAYVRNDAFLMKPPQSYYYSRAPLYHGVWTSEANARGLWSNGLERAGNWPVVEGGFIRETIRGSMHRLGLVDLAEDAEGNPLVRLNAVGAWLLGDGPEPDLSLPSGRALIVQPNFDVIVFPEGQEVGLLWPLMQATEVISRDVTLTLRVTADSIYRASQKAVSADQVLHLLEQNARAPIPDNVRQAISDWDVRYRQVSITTYVDIVEASSQSEMERFLEDVNNGQTVVRKISDTMGLVVGSASKLPAMTALDYAKSLPPSIHVSDNLEITVETGRENWLARPQLETIAENVGGNRYRVTSESVAAAMDKGITCSDALSLLEAASLDEIPRRAAFKLRGLFGDLGAAVVADATIVQVARESVLTRMLDIDDFRKHLLQRLGPTTALVHADSVDALNDLLDEFGIPEDEAILGEPSLPPQRDEESDAPDSEAPPRQRLQTYSSRKTRELLEEAIRQKKRVRLHYRAKSGHRPQERTVDPISIERRRGISFLTAYCHLRGEVQVFRIPSIDSLELLDSQSRS